MSTANVLDRFLDPVADCLTPEVAQRIMNVRLDPRTQSRLDELAEKANRGQLTQEDRSEYEDYVECMDFIGILKAKSRSMLQRHAT